MDGLGYELDTLYTWLPALNVVVGTSVVLLSITVANLVYRVSHLERDVVWPPGPRTWAKPGWV